MVRVIVLFAMLIAAASAFVAPANRAVGKSVVAFDETGVVGLHLPKWSYLLDRQDFFLARKFPVLISRANYVCRAALRAQVSNTAFARSSAPQAPKMSLDGAVDIVSNQVAANSNLIATDVSDNLGYLFPIVGILSLGALILYLSPPLAD
eukprot:scaffold258003_cov39-Attheya_sp.AAC.1